jgi:UDPglucose--hexose-1-phosphate uridylyltransferase
MPELRLDPITGRRVYVAEDRASRPTDFAEAAAGGPSGLAAAHDYEASCPFCAGNEAATPHETHALRDARGQWQVRVVPNKFPAMSLDAAGEAPASPLTPGPALGAHEVIIESPRHLVDVVQLSVEELAAVLAVYRDRLRHWAADGRLAHGLVFKNSGWAAGASLLHVHSQLVALPAVSESVAAELEGAGRFFASHRRCVFCDLVAREIAAGERMVLRQQGVVAVAAFAGRQPFETWLLPEDHASRFEGADDAALGALAAALHEVLRRLHAEAPGVAYNLLLHTAPFDDKGAASYHWHWELVPRTSPLAGLELGAGAYINSLSPERVAARLREARGGAGTSGFAG